MGKLSLLKTKVHAEVNYSCHLRDYSFSVYKWRLGPSVAHRQVTPSSTGYIDKSDSDGLKVQCHRGEQAHMSLETPVAWGLFSALWFRH